MKAINIILIGFAAGINLTSYTQGPPVFTESPIMLGLEGRAVRTFGHFISKENEKIYMQPLMIPYNITAKWLIGGMVPYVYKKPEGGESMSGLGDIKAFTKVEVIKRDQPRKTFRTLIKLEETFPTGNSGSTPPLGTGAYQTGLGLVSGYVTTKYGIYGELMYNLVSNGKTDNLKYNLAFGYPLLPQNYPSKQLNVYLELNGNFTVDDQSNQLFISPAVQYIAGRRVLIESGVQLPFVDDAKTGTKTNFTYLLGARILIF